MRMPCTDCIHFHHKKRWKNYLILRFGITLASTDSVARSLNNKLGKVMFQWKEAWQTVPWFPSLCITIKVYATGRAKIIHCNASYMIYNKPMNHHIKQSTQKHISINLWIKKAVHQHTNILPRIFPPQITRLRFYNSLAWNCLRSIKFPKLLNPPAHPSRIDKSIKRNLFYMVIPGQKKMANPDCPPKMITKFNHNSASLFGPAPG